MSLWGPLRQFQQRFCEFAAFRGTCRPFLNNISLKNIRGDENRLNFASEKTKTGGQQLKIEEPVGGKKKEKIITITIK